MPVISAMGNLPIVKDLVVDMEPFWEKFRSVDPYLQPGYEEPPDGKEYRIRQERMNVIHKEALCINCGCCVSECNAMESDPSSSARRRSRRRCASSATRATAQKLARLEKLNGEHGIWECTRCYFCNERCPKGVDPRDAIAKLGAESMKEGIDRDMGAKHAKWFVTSAKTTGWLRETELVPKTQGVVAAIKQTRFALDLARKGKVPPPFPPHVAKDVREARAPLRPRRTSRAAAATRASCRASARSRARARPRRRRDARGDLRAPGRVPAAVPRRRGRLDAAGRRCEEPPEQRRA